MHGASESNTTAAWKSKGRPDQKLGLAVAAAACAVSGTCTQKKLSISVRPAFHRSWALAGQCLCSYSLQTLCFCRLAHQNCCRCPALRIKQGTACTKDDAASAQNAGRTMSGPAWRKAGQKSCPKPMAVPQTQPERNTCGLRCYSSAHHNLSDFVGVHVLMQLECLAEF